MPKRSDSRRRRPTGVRPGTPKSTYRPRALHELVCSIGWFRGTRRLKINAQCKVLKAEARELGLVADCQFTFAGHKVCLARLPFLGLLTAFP